MNEGCVAQAFRRLCDAHDAYRWLRGGVSVNYHTLSDFRTQHGAALNELLTQSIAALLHRRVITLRRVAQDGMRVRASAGVVVPSTRLAAGVPAAGAETSRADGASGRRRQPVARGGGGGAGGARARGASR